MTNMEPDAEAIREAETDWADQQRLLRLYEVQPFFDSHTRERARHYGWAECVCQDPSTWEEDVILFWGFFLSRSDAIAAAYALECPVALQYALSIDFCWDIDPEDLETVLQELHEFTALGVAARQAAGESPLEGVPNWRPMDT